MGTYDPIRGPHLMSVYTAVHFRVLHFGCILLLLHELYLNMCVNNQNHDFWGP